MSQVSLPPSQANSDTAPIAGADSSTLDISDYLREEAGTAADPAAPSPSPQGFWALALGAVGVVYGDIGTSPIYTFREALRPAMRDGDLSRAEVLGLLSLIFWALILIVTLKYVLFLLRVDNRGEGGILALYTMVRLALGRRSVPVLLLAIAGAALFIGDAAITPAISVMSAVEGIEIFMPGLAPWVVPVTLVILTLLFFAQSHGTARISAGFGPVTALWFLTLAGLGLWHIRAAPEVLAALDPVWAFEFLREHAGLSFVVLGAVFLAVTGAEALYADLGHFGRRPIVLAWFGLIFPALVLNYLGQGALVLRSPAAIDNPLFAMVPRPALPWFIALATAATVIAAQAVITGAFSMIRASVQLGLLPRMRILHTAPGNHGQIYVPAVNWALLALVCVIVIGFGSSERMAAAYGISVTGTMVITSLLAIFYILLSRRLPRLPALALAGSILSVEGVFLSSNLSKIGDGGFIPLMIAGALGLAMGAWWRGTQKLLFRAHQSSTDLTTFVKMMETSSVNRVPGTAFFLTADPAAAPATLMHNIKFNGVVHEQTIILTVEPLRVPTVPEAERVSWQPLGGPFSLLTIRFGFMETPRIVSALPRARAMGLKIDVMRTIFFVARRRPVIRPGGGPMRLLDRLHIFLHGFSLDPSEYFLLPRERVIELGERISL
ncbi:potassium transporter Kup [Rhodobacter lacus]|uniref:Probable potassium transport system protein Kup n=1 Tax=Rhodobacter lacus TaxID=1641972 RepID=A0ABW5ABD3_9RHOB